MTTTISPESRWMRRCDEKQRRLDKVRELFSDSVAQLPSSTQIALNRNIALLRSRPEPCALR